MNSELPDVASWSCPLPLRDHDRVQLAHGGGGRFTQDLIDRIVHSVPGMMADDFDEANIARAASFMSVVMDPEWDADCPF